MTKREFLKKLKESLELSLSNDIIKEKIDYYDKYISDEIRNGRTEKDIIDELGEPALIAKTIKTVNGVSGDVFINDDFNNNTNNNANNNHTDYNSDYTKKPNNSYMYVNNTVIIGCIIAFLIIFIIVTLILRFIGYLAIGTVGTAIGLGPFGFIAVILIIWLLFGRNNRN